MNMNPQAMMQAMGALKTFQGNHPKFFSFVSDVFKTGIQEDTIIELTVTKPGEAPKTTNIKVKQSDLDLFNTLKNLG